MNHPVQDLVITQPVRILKALKTVLQKAQAHAKERNFDENTFLQLRLAPDMFPLVRQVQIASDTAKFAVARLTGQTAPSFEDKETTMAELMTRIDRTIEYVQSNAKADFSKYAETKQEFKFYPGKMITGFDYLTSNAVPNFYFHVMTTYCLIRQAGVNVGKQDFLGEVNWKNV